MRPRDASRRSKTIPRRLQDRFGHHLDRNFAGQIGVGRPLKHYGRRVGASCASEGVSEGLKACFGRCFRRTQRQLAARSCRGTWTKITRPSQVSEGLVEGLKACFGRCFWHAQLQLRLGHAEVHGPRLQGEAKSPKASPKASKHVLDVASGTRSFS